MAVELNHTIVAARDRDAAATFLTDILGLAPPRQLRHFAVVQIGGVSLDFVQADGEVAQRHFAFLVSEPEFDEIFERIKARGMTWWADPMRKQAKQINGWDDGRGLYFDDPSGHLLEIITRPYGSGGTTAKKPHPLIMPALDDDGGEAN
ncbi:MAG: VOC family protein [Alphaproteobacteria bacterium]